MANRRILMVAAAAWLLAACSRPQAVPAPKPLAVTVVAVAQRTVPTYGEYVGQTEAVKTVEIRARVEGYIERQVTPDGADVKAGDVLFAIDPRPFEATLRQAEANVARDVAQLRQAEAARAQRQADLQEAEANLVRDVAQADNARTQEGRYRTLVDRELIAREQYDQIRTSMVALDATAQAHRAAVGNAKAALLAAAATIENARATVRASEAAVEQVWQRRRAEMQARPGGITMTLPDDSEYPHDGRLEFVDRTVDPRTGTLALRATLPNPARVLRPGQYMRLRVLLEERPDALLVPQAAVLESQGSTSVFVVGPDRTVQARTVRTGPRVGTEWVIEDGLKAGETVVIKGLQQVRPGVRVEPTVEAAPPASR